MLRLGVEFDLFSKITDSDILNAALAVHPGHALINYAGKATCDDAARSMTVHRAIKKRLKSDRLN